MICETAPHRDASPFLANAGPAEARYLASLVADAARNVLANTELRLLGGTWRFSQERSERRFTEQFAKSAESLARFSLPAAEVAACQREWPDLVRAWCAKWRASFPAEQPRKATPDELQRASSLVLARATLGAPSLSGFASLPPDELSEYRRVLYAHNLDMLQHRLCYGSDG